MKIYRDINEIEFDKNTVLTLGTFDGVHLGHKKIIDRLKQVSKNENLRHILITLEPHPRIVLKKDLKNLKLLSTINERLELFKKLGLENCLIINFTEEFSKLTAKEFVKDYLYSNVGIKKFLIGYDHMFGNKREGDVNTLEDISKELSFDIESIEVYIKDKLNVSSTVIRKLLMNGEIEKANGLLSYPYFITGKVIKGKQIGRSLGFPTANIEPNSIFKLIPMNGVYITSIEINNKKLWGLTNIGNRPTIDDEEKLSIEVNLFDFNEDIYEKEIKVFFHSYIREEIKFKNKESLMRQINNDKDIALNFIKNNFSA